jgi:hypothetical protein
VNSSGAAATALPHSSRMRSSRRSEGTRQRDLVRTPNLYRKFCTEYYRETPINSQLHQPSCTF